MWRAALAAALIASASSYSVTLDAATAAHTYDGHGGLSAGASSRLLRDYPEPQRSQILDYLFKPQFGASLPLLKIEIGGDGQSTDGSEPSPEHTRGAFSCDVNRGYELWLLSEAKLRNPALKTYALSWASPNWIGNGSFYTQDEVDYQVAFASCAKQVLGGTPLDYIGDHNERSWGSIDYVVALRAALDAAGSAATQIIIPDGGSDIPGIIAGIESNASFADAVAGVGVHYPCNRPMPIIQDTLHKKFWSSEDYSTVGDWAGAGCWGRILSQNYVKMNQTSTIAWSLIWAVYPSLPYWGNGLMYSLSPWSGFYSGGGPTPAGPTPAGVDVMNGPIWTSAHWTQFTSVGWRFLSVPGGGSGMLPGGGSYVSLVPTPATGADVTLILETLQGACLRCAGGATSAQSVTVTLAGAGLPGAGAVLQAWRSNETAQFVREADVVVGADRSFTVAIGADEMLTLSTVTGASKGAFAPPPPAAPFPMPYADDFSGYARDSLARYFSDQAGSFAVLDGALCQVVPADPGANSWVTDPDPVSLIGGGATDAGWQDYAVAATTRFAADAPAVDGSSAAAVLRIGGRSSSRRSPRVMRERARALTAAPAGAAGDGNTLATLTPCVAGAPSQQWALGAAAPAYLSNVAAAGSAPQCANLDACRGDFILFACVTSGGTCCGATCYAGLQWALPAAGGAAGAITSPLAAMAGRCLAAAANGSLTMQPCGGAANQSWTRGADGTLALAAGAPGGGALCLTAPAPQSGGVYAQVCGRIAAYSGFSKAQPAGYCLVLRVDGSWELRAGAALLASGALPAPFNASAAPGTRIALAMRGTNITATITVLPAPAQQQGARAGAGAPRVVLAAGASVIDATYAGGMGAIGSGYHAASFDDFAFSAIAEAAAEEAGEGA